MLTKEEVAKMSRPERLERLGRFGHELDSAISDRPESVLCRRPDEKNWAPKEVVCHLRDTEEFFMIRFQTLAAAHEPPLVPADPTRWAEDRQYIRNDAAEASRAFRQRREESLAHLRGLADAQWSRAGLHPTYGRMTVEDIVNLMVWHDANHLDQLHRALTVASPRARELFRLLSQRLSIKEAAAVLGMSPATAYVHIYRTRAKVRRR